MPNLERSNNSRRNLYVFEGVDGVGKTSLAKEFYTRLLKLGIKAELFAFPGRNEGSLGQHVYQLHHHPIDFGMTEIDPLSLQILHVAAHVDTVNRYIVPALAAGKVVVLDRYWWSTWIYGLASGVENDVLERLIDVEKASVWKGIIPKLIFLIRREQPLREEPLGKWNVIRNMYDKRSQENVNGENIAIIQNDGTFKESADIVMQAYFAHLDS